jgi:hypothetical protein
VALSRERAVRESLIVVQRPWRLSRDHRHEKELFHEESSTLVIYDPTRRRTSRAAATTTFVESIDLAPTFAARRRWAGSIIFRSAVAAAAFAWSDR